MGRADALPVPTNRIGGILTSRGIWCSTLFGYPTGSEGFRFSIPAKHFPVGTHTMHMRYTSGNGTTYSMVDTAFTVKAKAEHAFAVKTSGHKYYVYNQGYTWAEVQAFAEKEKLMPANVNTPAVQAFLTDALTSGTMQSYWVAGQKCIDASGTIKATTEDSTRRGFILEAVDLAPSKTAKHGGYLFALIDEVLTDEKASSLQSTMAAELATMQDMDEALIKALLLDAECDAFRLQDGYILKNGKFSFGSVANAGIIFKYAKSTLPEKYATHNGSRFYAINTVMPWQGAKAMAEMLGGRLAIIPDTATQDAIHTVVKDNACFSYWVGGDDIEEEGSFRWLDGTAMSNTLRCYIGEPNNYEYREDYLMVYRDYDSALNDNGAENPQGMTAGFILEVRDDFYTPIESFVLGDKIYVRYEGTFTKRTAELVASALGGTLIPEGENMPLLAKLKALGTDSFWAQNGKLFSTISGITFASTRANKNAHGLILCYDFPQKAVTTVTDGGKTFAIFDASMSYDAAKAFSLHIGGRLAEPCAPSQNAALARAVQAGKQEGYYIGMNDSFGSFSWESGATASYTNWGAVDTDYPHTGHIAYMKKDGTWVKAAHQTAGMRPMGVAVEWEGTQGNVTSQTIYRNNTAEVEFTISAGNLEGAAKLIYGFYDADGRMISAKTEDVTLSKADALSLKRELPPSAEALSLLLWHSVAGLMPTSAAAHPMIRPKTALVPKENAAIGGFIESGIYSILTDDKQTVTLSEHGLTDTTTLTLSDDAHPLFGRFHVQTDDDGNSYIYSLISEKGLTVGSSMTFTDAPTPIKIEQQADGTFLLRFSDGSVLGKSLMRETENGEATQKFTFVPQKPLRERTATVKTAGQLRYGAADDFPVMAELTANTEVLLLGEKYEIDGIRWCYVKTATSCGFIRTDSLSIPIESLDDIPWVTGWKATTYGYNGDDNGLCAWSGCAWGNGSPSYRVIDGCHVAVPSYCVKGTAEAYANYPELAGGYGTILEVRNPANGATCYAIVADFGNFGVGNKYNQTAALDLPPNTCAALGLGQKTYDIEYRPVGKLSRWSGSQAELIRAVEEQN
ncbi:MAG: hypothetical protein II359_04390 [Clostridia bacterium]|nr:hypothetical protein [Clostridia bacterium]